MSKVKTGEYAWAVVHKASMEILYCKKSLAIFLTKQEALKEARKWLGTTIVKVFISFK